MMAKCGDGERAAAAAAAAAEAAAAEAEAPGKKSPDDGRPRRSPEACPRAQSRGGGDNGESSIAAAGDAAVGNGEVVGSGEAAAAGTPPAAAATIEPGHYGRTMITTMTREEYDAMYRDVYGKPPRDVERMERRMADLQREVGSLPEGQKSSVLRALRYNPLLFVSSAHTNLFLQAEEFDAKQGAVRMARYWEQRERMFGERAFSPEVFNNPTREDYLKYYQRCTVVAADPTADDTMRAVSRHYVSNVRKAKIVAMDAALERTPRHEMTALLDARRLSPDLAASDEHKLLFLHCTDFYERKAAEQMIRYWETKREIFGPEMFHRGIRARDLEGDGVDAKDELDSGLWRLMPETDEHGRSVVVLSYSRLSHEFRNEKALDAVTWYVIHCALERPSCQRNGVVYMINYKAIDRELPGHQPSFRKRCLRIMFDNVPVNAKASHILFGTDCTWWQKIIVPGFSVLGKMMKMKAVVHYGTDEELMAELRDHGITENCVPAELGGNVTFDSWRDMLKERRAAGI